MESPAALAARGGARFVAVSPGVEPMSAAAMHKHRAKRPPSTTLWPEYAIGSRWYRYCVLAALDPAVGDR